MLTWDQAAPWYLEMVGDPARGFNDLAADTALSLLGDVDGRQVLDVGCGEGHVARRLARLGARVAGTEPTATLLAAAQSLEDDQHLGITYGPQPAEDLAGIEDGTQDAACAVLVLHHVADLDRALTEIHRVLRAEGVFVAVLPHPWTDHSGASWLETPDGPRRVLGAYPDEGFWSSPAGAVPAGVAPAGSAPAGSAPIQSIRNIGWHHRTLATWMTATARAGFRLSEVTEPVGVPTGDVVGPWAEVPRFLAFRAVRSG